MQNLVKEKLGKMLFFLEQSEFSRSSAEVKEQSFVAFEKRRELFNIESKLINLRLDSCLVNSNKLSKIVQTSEQSVNEYAVAIKEQYAAIQAKKAAAARESEITNATAAAAKAASEARSAAANIVDKKTPATSAGAREVRRPGLGAGEL